MQEKAPQLSLLTKKEEQKLEKIPFSRKLHYWLIKNKTWFTHRTYGIKFKYNGQKTIQYLLEVKCEKYRKEVFYYSIERKQFFKNGKQLDGLMEELAEQSSEIMYPLKVTVNTSGQITGITNHEEIEKRWKIKQKYLVKRYSGEPFINYCKSITEAISTQESLLKSLRNDLIYDILFSKIYMNYSKNFTQPVAKKFKWFPKVEKVNFSGNQCVNSILKTNGRILIDYIGTMQPVEGIKKGGITIQYQLDKFDHTLLRVDGKFDYIKDTTKEIIEFSAIWQKDMDKTKLRRIEDKKRKGIYIDPNAEKKWYEFWK